MQPTEVNDEKQQACQVTDHPYCSHLNEPLKSFIQPVNLSKATSGKLSMQKKSILQIQDESKEWKMREKGYVWFS